MTAKKSKSKRSPRWGTFVCGPVEITLFKGSCYFSVCVYVCNRCESRRGDRQGLRVGVGKAVLVSGVCGVAGGGRWPRPIRDLRTERLGKRILLGFGAVGWRLVGWFVCFFNCLSSREHRSNWNLAGSCVLLMQAHFPLLPPPFGLPFPFRAPPWASPAVLQPLLL